MAVTSRAADLRVEMLSERDALDRLPAAAWNDLWERTPDSSPFQGRTWLTSWWHHFGEEAELCSIAVWRGERLQVLLPLMISRRAGFRVLQLVGTGRSDYLDLLHDPEDPEAVARGLAALGRLRHAWDFGLLFDLREKQRCDWWEAALRGQGLRTASIVRTRSLYRPLPNSWQEFLEGCSASFRRDLRRAEKRLRRLGRCDIRRITAPDEVAARLPDLYRVDAESWKSRAGTARFSGRRARGFFDEVLPRLAEDGVLELWFLDFEGQAAAFNIDFCWRERIYLYNGSYTLAPFSTRASPGTVLLTHIYRDAVERGMREIDFLRGDEPYKLRWTTAQRTCHQLLVGDLRPRSLLGRWLLIRPRWFLKRYPWALRLKQELVRISHALRRDGQG